MPATRAQRPLAATGESVAQPGSPRETKNKYSFLKSGFPCSSVGKESAYSAGHPGSIPGSGRCPGEGNGSPLQDPCLEKCHGQMSLVGCSPWGHKASATNERLTHKKCKVFCPLLYLSPVTKTKIQRLNLTHVYFPSYLIGHCVSLDSFWLQGTKLLIKSSLDGKGTSEGNGAGCLQKGLSQPLNN